MLLTGLTGLIGLIGLAPVGCIEELECSDACPQGTALASSAELRSDSVQVIASTCAATCDPIEPCLPPNVPAFSGSGESMQFECRAQDGYGTLPRAEDLDTRFGYAWEPIPELLDFTPLPITIDSLYIEVADRDRDGIDELFAYTFDEESYWIVPTAGGDLTLESAGVIATYPTAFGDVDGDGVADILQVLYSGNIGLTICPGLSDYTFSDACTFTTLTADSTMVSLGGALMADADGDGDEDLLVVGDSSWYSENLGGVMSDFVTLGHIGYSDIGSWGALQQGDVNGDGLADVLIRESDATGGGYWLTLGSAQGWGELQRAFEVDTNAAVLADTDADGVDELVTVASSGELGVYGWAGGPELLESYPAAYADTTRAQHCLGVDWDLDGVHGVACTQDATMLIWRDDALWDVQRPPADMPWQDYGGAFIVHLPDGPAYVGFTPQGSQTLALGSRP